MVILCNKRYGSKHCEYCYSNLLKASELIATAFLSKHKLLVCGNGGSCSDSDHIVAEFIKTRIRRTSEGFIGFKAISLCSNSSVITAISNDYGYDMVFAQQIYALGDPGDVLLALSTSGKSKNICFALEAAKKHGLSTILLTGCLGENSNSNTCTINSCGNCTEEIQERHIVLYHALCKEVLELCCSGS